MANKPSTSDAMPPGVRSLVRRAMGDLRQAASDTPRDTVLYLGQRHHAFPALLVADPVLGPVDKIIWMTLWQRGAGGGTQAPCPTYAEIAANAHVRSDTTIARGLAILRATRWLSLCARVRGPQGKFRGNVYAMHDEPLPLADAVHLDPEYLAFLEMATSHPHPRVCKVAASVLASLDADIHGGIDVTAREHPIARRLEALNAIAQPGAFRYFSFTAAILKALTNAPIQSAPDHRLQILESADPLQDLESDRSSSNNKTTTTEEHLRAPARETVLYFPRVLSDNQRALARHYLQRAPACDHQAILDELEGRLRAVRKGARALYDPLRYFHRLCDEAALGRFVVNLGGEVQAARTRRNAAAEGQSPGEHPSVSRSAAAPIPDKRPGKSPVAGIRQQFNLPSRLKPPT